MGSRIISQRSLRRSLTRRGVADVVHKTYLDKDGNEVPKSYFTKRGPGKGCVTFKTGPVLLKVQTGDNLEQTPESEEDKEDVAALLSGVPVSSVVGTDKRAKQQV